MLDNKLKIGGRVYSIFVESSKTNPVFNEHKDAFGYIDYASSQIKIRNDIDKQFQIETLLHELLHGLLDNSGIDGVNTDKITKILAPRLHAFFIDNPSFQDDIFKT